MMSNPVEQWQLQEVMSERASAPETDTEAALNWESDPEAWKEPHAAAPHMTSLVQNFEELHEGKSLLDGLKSPLSEADPEFLDLVKAYWAQMKRDHSPLLPLTADAHELHRLSAKDMAVSLDRMNEIMRSVFDWMISQGKQPVPGWTTWNVGLPPELEEWLED
jgi:hypothetical protein